MPTNDCLNAVCSLQMSYTDVRYIQFVTTTYLPYSNCSKILDGSNIFMTGDEKSKNYCRR